MIRQTTSLLSFVFLLFSTALLSQDYGIHAEGAIRCSIFTVGGLYTLPVDGGVDGQIMVLDDQGNMTWTDGIRWQAVQQWIPPDGGNPGFWEDEGIYYNVGNANVSIGTDNVSWWNGGERILRIKSPISDGSSLFDMSNQDGSSFLNLTSGDLGNHPQVRWAAGKSLRFYAHAPDWSVYREIMTITQENAGGEEQGFVQFEDFIKLNPRDSAPTNPSDGTVYYDATDHVLKVWVDNGVDTAEWKTLSWDP